jgi:hypothetical protein
MQQNSGWLDLERRGIGRGEFDLYEDEHGYRWLWARCEVPDCPNNVCARLNDRFCWPHLMSGRSVDESDKTEMTTT